MAKQVTRFSPNRDGFHFVNRFEVKLPIRYDLPFGGSINLNEVVFGLCGGMCFSALDYFYAGVEFPSYQRVEEIDVRFLTYLCDRQLDSLRLPTLLKLIDWIFLSDEKLSARISRYEIAKLRRMLDRGEPASLALIRSRGFEDPTRNHQVVATGYEVDPRTQGMRIYLYDPNYPGQEPFLQASLLRDGSGLHLTQSTGEFLRGFFIMPYKRVRRVPPVIPQARDLLGRDAALVLPFQLGWPVDSRRVNQFFGENPDSYRPFGLPGHEGLDLFVLSGGNVYAAADGEVVQADHPSNHPYGLQIRIKHATGGKVFHTIYAHLQETVIQKGQQVSRGDRIGLADNSGNSFGSHLHLTLKIDGEKTPGYPAGIVDPWPYLQAGEVQPSDTLPAPSGVKAFTIGQVNLRTRPSLDAEILTFLPAGEALDLLGESSVVSAKIGQQGTWLPVQTASGQAGYVAAWYLQSTNQVFPPSDIVVYPNDTVNLRSGPGTAFNQLETLQSGAPLTVLGSGDAALGKIGRQGEWIQVQTLEGTCGFVAAWLVHRTGQAPASSGLTVYPVEIVNVRSGSSLDANILTVATPGDPLLVLGEKDSAQAKIGKPEAWLNVRTPGKFTGYVAAWLVKSSPAEHAGSGPGDSLLTIYPTGDINMRAQASENSPRVSGARRNETLTVMEADQEAARRKVGQAGQWIYAQKENGSGGWVAAWLVSLTKG